MTEILYVLGGTLAVLSAIIGVDAYRNRDRHTSMDEWGDDD